MIELKAEWGLYLNIVMALIVITSLVQGYNKGLIKGIINLVRMIIALIVATIFSGPLAEVFPLLNYRSGTVAEVITNALQQHGSKMIWFSILFIVAYIATIILEWSMGFVDRIPIVKSVNKLAGLAFGFVLAFFKLYLLLIILVLPLFKNSQAIIDNSYMKVIQDSSGVIDGFAQVVNDSMLTQKAGNKEELDPSESNRLEEILKDYGLSQEQIVDYLEGLK